MKVKIIMSCDDNPYYLDFWPLVSKIWAEKIGIEPFLVHIGNNTPIPKYGEVKSIQASEAIPIHTQAQLGRIWHTINEPETLWITSDIDMFPMSRKYWIETIAKVRHHTWTNINSSLDYFPICYNIAKGYIYENVLEINKNFSGFCTKVINSTDQDLKHKPNNWPENAALSKWNVDELYTSEKLCIFRDKMNGDVYQPTSMGTLNKRLDRSNWVYDKNIVKKGGYGDCHSLRPYSKYKVQIDELIELI